MRGTTGCYSIKWGNVTGAPWDDTGKDFVSANERSQSGDSGRLRVRGEGVKAVGTGGKGASSPDPAENSGSPGTDYSLVGRQTEVALV